MRIRKGNQCLRGFIIVRQVDAFVNFRAPEAELRDGRVRRRFFRILRFQLALHAPKKGTTSGKDSFWWKLHDERRLCRAPGTEAATDRTIWGILKAEIFR
jgi:hypothetical protein